MSVEPIRPHDPLRNVPFHHLKVNGNNAAFLIKLDCLMTLNRQTNYVVSFVYKQVFRMSTVLGDRSIVLKFELTHTYM